MPKDILSDEDRALFRQMTEGVVPLKKNAVKDTSRKPQSTPMRITKPIKTVTTFHIHLSDAYAYNHEVQSETCLSYCQHPIPQARFNELKKGQIPWEKKLDLHGFTSNEASEKLLQFLHQAQNQGLRCLLVIHGKGGRNSLTNPTPVLKNLVNHWLKQIPEVLAFHSAIAKDGGSGAMYILLKKGNY